MNNRQNPDYLRHAKTALAEAKIFEEAHNILRNDMDAAKISKVKPLSEDVVLARLIAKKHAEKKRIALALQTDGLNPQAAARWIRHRKKD